MFYISFMRKLTTHEIALAREVFGDSIDYARVTVRASRYIPFQPKESGMAPNGHLYMYGCYSDDYANTSLRLQALFIHEMTHVWQYQNRVVRPVWAAAKLMLRHAFNYSAAYPFMLAPYRDLVSYNLEQQASIVEAFFISTHGRPSYRGFCRNACDDTERLRLYRSVLENFLKNPAYARR